MRIADWPQQERPRERLLAQGAEPVGSTPAQFATVIGDDMRKWGKIVRETGAKAE